MKRALMTLSILLLTASVRAATYLGTDDQPVSNLPGRNLLVESTTTLKVQQMGSVTVTPGTGTWSTTGSTVTIVLPAGQAALPVTGTFSASGSSVTVFGPNGGPVDVSGNVGVTGTVTANAGTGIFNTTGSTNVVAGAGGLAIKSTTLSAGGQALNVVGTGPNLDGKALVYAVDNNMAVGTLSLTGLIKSVDLQALQGSCTFDINGGASIVVTKNTSESFDLAYTLTNAAVNLTAKDSNATCKARVVGAN